MKIRASNSYLHFYHKMIFVNEFDNQYISYSFTKLELKLYILDILDDRQFYITDKISQRRGVYRKVLTR